jgi:hypothetical protein
MNPQAVIVASHTVQHALGLVGNSLQHRHHHRITKLKALVIEMMTQKVTQAQSEIIRTQAMFVLDLIAEEHKLVRQEFVLDKAAYRAATCPVTRAELNSSIDRGAAQLERIRRDAMAFHGAVAVLLARAAEQILQFSGDLSLQMPRELGESAPPPVIDTVGVPANDTDVGEVGR